MQNAVNFLSRITGFRSSTHRLRLLLLAKSSTFLADLHILRIRSTKSPNPRRYSSAIAFLTELLLEKANVFYKKAWQSKCTLQGKRSKGPQRRRKDTQPFTLPQAALLAKPLVQLELKLSSSGNVYYREKATRFEAKNLC